MHHELIIVLKGSHYVQCEHGKFHAKCGDLLFYKSHMAHSEYWNKDISTEILFFGFTGEFNQPIMSHDFEGRVLKLAEWTYEEHIRGNVQMRDQYFNLLLQEVKTVEKNQSSNNIISKTQDYILNHIDTKITVADLAQHAGMSKFHFIRKYKKLRDCTPIADLRRIRVEEARQLIITTDLPLKSIPDKVGIQNEYYMSRMFKEILGQTPGFYRQ